MPTSLDLGDYFERFIAEEIAQGRYRNKGEVMRAALRLLEAHEMHLKELQALVAEGDRAYTEGRYVTVDKPGDLAKIVSRGLDQAAAGHAKPFSADRSVKAGQRLATQKRSSKQ